jgi:hypothetical protein
VFYFAVALIGIPSSVIGVWQLVSRLRELLAAQAAQRTVVAPEPCVASMLQNFSPGSVICVGDPDQPAPFMAFS